MYLKVSLLEITARSVLCCTVPSVFLKEQPEKIAEVVLLALVQHEKERRLRVLCTGSLEFDIYLLGGV